VGTGAGKQREGRHSQREKILILLQEHRAASFLLCGKKDVSRFHSFHKVQSGRKERRGTGGQRRKKKGSGGEGEPRVYCVQL
jgi:hypothetical protein